MHARRLGAGGPTVSAVGLGGMYLSINGRPDEATALATIHAALEDRGEELVEPRQPREIRGPVGDAVNADERLLASRAREREEEPARHRERLGAEALHLGDLTEQALELVRGAPI